MVLCMLLWSISNSLLGTLCFIGVIKSFVANEVASLGEIKERNLPVAIINRGIFNDSVGLDFFFDIIISFVALLE